MFDKEEWKAEQKRRRKEYQQKQKELSKDRVAEYKKKCKELQKIQRTKQKQQIFLKKVIKFTNQILAGNIHVSKYEYKYAELLPWNIRTLKTHIESQFDAEMTWDNYKYSFGPKDKITWSLSFTRPSSNFVFDFKILYNTAMSCAITLDESWLQFWSLDNISPKWD